MLDAEPEDIIRLFIEYHELNKYVAPSKAVLPPRLVQFREFHSLNRAIKTVLAWLDICRQNDNEKEIWSEEAEQLSLVKELVCLIPELSQVVRIVDFQAPQRVEGGGPGDLIIAIFSISPTFPAEPWEVIKRLLGQDYRPSFEKQWSAGIEPPEQIQ